MASRTRHSPGDVTTIRDGLCRATARFDLTGEAAVRRRSASSRAVVDGPARCAQFVREVAHGREKERDLLLVMADVGRLFPDLAHQHDGARGIGRLQRRQRQAQLVAEHKHQSLFGGSVLGASWAAALRRSCRCPSAGSAPSRSGRCSNPAPTSCATRMASGRPRRSSGATAISRVRAWFCRGSQRPRWVEFEGQLRLGGSALARLAPPFPGHRHAFFAAAVLLLNHVRRFENTELLRTP